MKKFHFLYFAGTYECINWHERKNINVELYDEMFCAGYSDGHQDACLGKSSFSARPYSQ